MRATPTLADGSTGGFGICQPHFYGETTFRPATFGDLRIADVADYVVTFLGVKDAMALRQVCRGWRLCALTALHYEGNVTVKPDLLTGMWHVALRPSPQSPPFHLGLWPRRILELTLMHNEHTASWMNAIQLCTPRWFRAIRARSATFTSSNNSNH